MSSFPSVVAGQVGTEIELSAGKTYTNGVFDSSTDPTFTSVTGATCEAIIIFVKTAGANTTWPVVAYLDTNITNLPVTPNGGNISVTWNALASLACKEQPCLPTPNYKPSLPLCVRKPM